MKPYRIIVEGPQEPAREEIVATLRKAMADKYPTRETVLGADQAVPHSLPVYYTIDARDHIEGRLEEIKHVVDDTAPRRPAEKDLIDMIPAELEVIDKKLAELRPSIKVPSVLGEAPEGWVLPAPSQVPHLTYDKIRLIQMPKTSTPGVVEWFKAIVESSGCVIEHIGRAGGDEAYLEYRFKMVKETIGSDLVPEMFRAVSRASERSETEGWGPGVVMSMHSIETGGLPTRPLLLAEVKFFEVSEDAEYFYSHIFARSYSNNTIAKFTDELEKAKPWSPNPFELKIRVLTWPDFGEDQSGYKAAAAMTFEILTHSISGLSSSLEGDVEGPVVFSWRKEDQGQIPRILEGTRRHVLAATASRHPTDSDLSIGIYNTDSSGAVNNAWVISSARLGLITDLNWDYTLDVTGSVSTGDEAKAAIKQHLSKP